MCNNNKQLNQAKLIQLQILNERANLYASRMWQVPFVYISSTVFALIKIDQSYIDKIFLNTGFAIFGLLVLLIIRNIMERINLLLDNLTSIEKDLGLIKTIEKLKTIPILCNYISWDTIKYNYLA